MITDDEKFPCRECRSKNRFVDRDGSICCPSSKKCKRYLKWFGEKWTWIQGMLRRGE